MIIRKLTEEECHSFLKEIMFGRLGCVRDKQPYVVPIYFVSDGQHLYGFTTPGQKIRWMRLDRLVCVEADNVVDHLNWTSVVVFGKYHEIRNKVSSTGLKEYALELLQRRTMWWQPASVPVAAPSDGAAITPIFYRISIDKVTGHRAGPDTLEEQLPLTVEHELAARDSVFRS